jgi:hypothetical protein
MFGADVEHRDNVSVFVTNRNYHNFSIQFGYTALMGATYYGMTDVMGLLLQNNADINAQSNVLI